MSEKLKLTTYIHKNVSPSARKTVGFKEALNFLNELYVASENPAHFSWSSDHKRQRIFKGGWAHISAAFNETTRASMYVDSVEGNLRVEVSFHKGEEIKWHRIEAVFSPRGMILSAKLGDWHA